MFGMSDFSIGYLKILDHLLIGSVGEKSTLPSSERLHHDVETVALNSWAGMKEAFCEGHIQGGFLPLPEAMSLFNSGLDIKILLFDCCPGTMVVSNKAAGIVKLNDFKGKTVLISNLLSVHYLLFYKLMRSAGLSTGIEHNAQTYNFIENNAPPDVFIEIVPPFMIPEMISCDINGDIGGCMVEEPFASRIIYEGYGKKVCSSGMLWPDHPHTALVMRDEMIQNDRPSVFALVRQIVESNQSIYRNSPDLHIFLKKVFGSEDQKIFDMENQSMSDREMIEKTCLSSLPVKPFSLMPDINFLEIINDFMVNEMGLLNSIIHMNDFVDLQFALEAEA